MQKSLEATIRRAYCMVFSPAKKGRRKPRRTNRGNC